MSFSDDEEILEDFLIEAGEILEQLSEQLVELERRPDDAELLNAIFRGFHTVKGGAGFLQLTPLVDCCHVTENLFDILRTGKRAVTAELMDVVLQVLDVVNCMFQQVKDRTELTPASPALIAALEALVAGEELSSTPEHAAAGDDITDDEFEQMLAALGNPSADASNHPVDETGSGVDEITDDEFEALLDTLHGAGKGISQAMLQDGAQLQSDESIIVAAEKGDDITDDEFEALLDALHGSGKHQGIPDDVPAAAPVKPQASKAADKPIAKPALALVKSNPVPEPVAKDATVETTVRVDTRRLDEIMNMVGELVLVRNRLVRIGARSADEVLSKAIANLDLVTADLQTSVMKTRMQPIRKVFGRFPRVVRDLARSLGKEVSLELHGEDTDLDKNLVEALADPLVHLVRNAVDHGIEIPAVREKHGKSRQGTILLAAEQEGDHILLTISDDGAGMDPNVLRNKALEKGVMDRDAADRLTDEECFELIFAPGFSTKTEISDVSGRGVGMDVVKTKIAQLNGSIYIHSKPGQGSRIEIKVPLTLAIMPTLMVMVGEQAFALPLVSVNEIFHLDLKRTNVVDGQQVITVREKSLPLFHLKRWLIRGEAAVAGESAAHVVIVTVGTHRIGFVVDHLIGQEEVVIKPLGKMLHGTPGMAGATITGDGRIALILDVPGLLKRYAG
ncbi:MAG: chemotaxis protein CheA [Gammaproteobacteria bacterium]|nr:chemotaxis protein CheA [Gammaproteobacteria bacterium]MDP2140859.1 chemotaxis protein CheA [Gammaproteobacteria bacterium]MDP2349398.1 chemotaxis protein CheA [Gammaproteobacteria bacterium]